MNNHAINELFKTMQVQMKTMDRQMNAKDKGKNAEDEKMKAIQDQLKAMKEQMDAKDQEKDAMKKQMDAKDQKIDAMKEQMDTDNKRLNEVERDLQIMRCAIFWRAHCENIKKSLVKNYPNDLATKKAEKKTWDKFLRTVTHLEKDELKALLNNEGQRIIEKFDEQLRAINKDLGFDKFFEIVRIRGNFVAHNSAIIFASISEGEHVKYLCKNFKDLDGFTPEQFMGAGSYLLEQKEMKVEDFFE